MITLFLDKLESERKNEFLEFFNIRIKNLRYSRMWNFLFLLSLKI